MKIRTSYLLLLLSLISFELSGCATAGKNTLPRGGDLTMANIYRQETGLSLNTNTDKEEINLLKARNYLAPNAKINYASYTATSARQINNLFKAFPNPEVPIYIYPHLVHSDDSAQPVPGYTTVFFLYKRNHFALPSEVY